MKKNFLLIILLSTLILSCTRQVQVTEKTFCNPVDLNYRFQSTERRVFTPRTLPGGRRMDTAMIKQMQAEAAKPQLAYREAADPVVLLYEDKYFLFASHSGGYWYSDDMLDWTFLPIKSMPIENYAPAVIVRNDTFFYKGNAMQGPDYIYYSTDPFTDNWKPMQKSLPFTMNDAAFFIDDNNDFYIYYGLSMSDDEPIRVVQLNSEMQPVSDPIAAIPHNTIEHGWEIPGEYNEIVGRNGCNEGSWMTKYNSKYYLQFASPGTEWRSYADGVYTSDAPAGPFTYEQYSPFSYKPGGFIRGAGHSATFQDKYGNYWHIATMQISIRHNFERRLGLFPAYFDSDGVLRTITAFGDYPTVMPDRKIDFDKESLFAGWMLLSYNKKVTASSSLDELPVKNASDENIQTWWSAKTGDPGEWMGIELADNVTINAIQLNFADNDATLTINSSRNNIYCYRVLASDDQKNWKVIIDKSNNTRDACHEYIVLDKPLKAKYIKIENVKVPDGKFSIYDLRIFGNRKGEKPKEAYDINIERDPNDSRRASVMWSKDSSANGYIINYGTDINKLYTSVMVYDINRFRLTGLNKGITYYVSIDSFNESGVTKGTKIIQVK